MKQLIKYYILNIVTVITVTMFFSCNNNYNEVQNLGISENEPIGEAENINLKYTDSGKVAINLISPKRLDYSNRGFPFEEFPEGITLYIYDEDSKTTVVSDYAISYKKTGIIDLQGNVVITSDDGDVLRTEQLYYFQKNQWLFTNNHVEITGKDGSLIKGGVFDAQFESGKGLTFLSIYEAHDSHLPVQE
ncbi:LPS export ABC transporter periplasmic protein LptC [Seonamhaeicola sp. MEBiC1930]|uniref:LPS export ABC transporter periplasmic protein LptC n=1 Tax=Seonamhaeicola sp. MEBiC01930 TaxID=2976768 RepID=UPI003247BC30